MRQLQWGVNYVRWIEYAFSASTMIVLIAMLVGIYELAALLLVFALNAAMILFGWMMELHNQSTARTDWTAFVFGSLGRHRALARDRDLPAARAARARCARLRLCHLCLAVPLLQRLRGEHGAAVPPVRSVA